MLSFANSGGYSIRKSRALSWYFRFTELTAFKCSAKRAYSGAVFMAAT